MNKFKHLDEIIDCDGEVHISKSRHFQSLVQVYVDKMLIVESASRLTKLKTH
jgi:hypothetical protein